MPADEGAIDREKREKQRRINAPTANKSGVRAITGTSALGVQQLAAVHLLYIDQKTL
jgi:hypothetical protein